MARKKDASPPDPGKLVRERAGAYRTADGRFTVESQASGAWFVIDAEQLDELGMARVMGPYGKLDQAKNAMEQARAGPPVTSLLRVRAEREQAGRAGTRGTRAGTARAERREDEAQGAKKKPVAKPRPPRIRYTTSTEGIRANQLRGFFTDWADPPPPETLRRLLAGSDEVVLAVDDESDRVVGFVTALTDRVVSAYVPLVEILSDFDTQGIAPELVRRMVARLGDIRIIDLVANRDLKRVYEEQGFKQSTAMSMRREGNR